MHSFGDPTQIIKIPSPDKDYKGLYVPVRKVALREETSGYLEECGSSVLEGDYTEYWVYAPADIVETANALKYAFRKYLKNTGEFLTGTGKCKKDLLLPCQQSRI